MSGIEKAAVREVGVVLGALLFLSGYGQGDHKQDATGDASGTTQPAAPASIPMGGSKSVTRFFVTGKGLGKGGNLGGLAGADAHCQALAQAQGAGDHTWPLI